MLKRLLKVPMLCLLAAWLALTAAGPAAASALPLAAVATGPIPWDQNLKFEHLTIADGLSQSSVQAILQDSQGFLWFGTQDGLNRYDGNTVIVFTPDPDDENSLSDSWVQVLAEDSQGGLWIGSQHSGLNRYDPLTGFFTHYRHDPEDPGSLGSNTINTLYVDRSGVLWIGASNGLDCYQPGSIDSSHNTPAPGASGTGTFIHYQPDPADPASLGGAPVFAILEDSHGALWVGTEEGLDRLDRQSGQFTHFRRAAQRPDSLPDDEVLHLYEDAGGVLWVGTHAGLARFDADTQTFTNFPLPDKAAGQRSTSVDALTGDSQGLLWVGTKDGLLRFDPASGRSLLYRSQPQSSDSLSNDVILSLYEDRGGILWIGTFGGGANKLDPGRLKFTHFKHNSFDPASLSENVIFQLAESADGSIWIATYGGGLDRLDRQTGQFTHYRHQVDDPQSLLDDHVWAVHEDAQGAVWVGTDQGLTALDPQTGLFIHYVRDEEQPDWLESAAVYMIYEDSRGDLWLGMYGGLVRFDRQQGKFERYRHTAQDAWSIKEGNILCIYETRDGALWLGSGQNGLASLDRESGRFEYFLRDESEAHGPSSNAVLSILEDRSGMLWIGTAGGLNRLDRRTGLFIHYTEKDGLPNNTVYGVLEDHQGYLWLSTNNGLSRFDPSTETFVNFDEGDGLQSREFNMTSYLLTWDGSLLFGGVNGLNLFDPVQIAANPYLPPVALTNFTQGGQALHIDQTVEMLQGVRLYWPHNYFEFEFAALSYAEPHKNQYAYQLEGFDENWVQNGSLYMGRYTNLPGGTYTLRLKASNNDGVWNEEGRALRVVMVPPFWQTLWFRSAALLAAAASVFGGYRWRLRSMETHNRQLEQQVQDRTRKIEQLFEQTKELAIIEERNRLARELHDSAKQKAFAALAQVGAARSLLRRDPNKAWESLAEVENLVYEVIQELAFLIQEMYPLALRDKGLAAVLREYVYEWENRTGIPVQLKIQDERRLALQTEQALYRIVQEALANVTRHSQAAGVQVELLYAPDCVKMSLQDNGRGFDLAGRPSGVGLRSMQERAALVQGSFQIESQPGKGTRIFVHVPLEAVINGE